MSITARRWLVGIVWTAVGLMLVWRGLPYAGFRHVAAVQGLAGTSRWLALGLGLVLGVAKGATALRRSARKAVAGIVGRGQQAPVWTVFGPSMLLLVGGMVVLGLVLRLAPYDVVVKAWLVGTLYPAIGTALVLGGCLAVRLPEA